MTDDTDLDRANGNGTAAIVKAIGALLLVWALIAAPAVWRIRELCLLHREECGYSDLVDWVLSDRVSLIGAGLVLSAMLFIGWHFARMIRGGSFGIAEEDEPPARRLNVNGLWVALVVAVVYVGVSAAILTSASVDADLLDPGNVNLFVWKLMGPIYGVPLVFMILWHLNDFIVKPVSNAVLVVLFLATFGSVYLVIKSTVLSF